MKKAHLTRKLSEIQAFESPRVELEQYQTPPQLAADIVYTCYMQGNREVIDLGAGTGIIAVGAALMGMNVTAVEVDRKALQTARENAESLDVDIDFVEKDVSNYSPEKVFDAVLMNPPFNVQSDEGLLFWRKALEIGDSVYGLAGKGFKPRLKRLCSELNHRIAVCEAYTIGLPSSYDFHTESVKDTPVDLYVTESKK